MLKFTEWSKTPGITLKKHTEGKKKTFSEGNQLFPVNFPTNLDEGNADMVQLTKNETGDGFSNIKDTFAESLQLQMLGLHQSRVHQGWSIKFK